MGINSVGSNYNQYPIQDDSLPTLAQAQTALATINTALSQLTPQSSQAEASAILNPLIYGSNNDETTSPFGILMYYSESSTMQNPKGRALPQSLSDLYNLFNANRPPLPYPINTLNPLSQIQQEFKQQQLF